MNLNLGAIAAFVVGAILGIGLARLMRNRGVARIRVRRDVTAPVERIIGLIREVEREPEMIPFVRKIDVLERRGDSVRYRATFGLGIPLWAVYMKSADPKKQRVQWRSQSGAFGLKHSGKISFKRTARGARAELSSEYSFEEPIVGALLTLITELLVAGAMSAWLRNLDKAAGEA